MNTVEYTKLHIYTCNNPGAITCTEDEEVGKLLPHRYTNDINNILHCVTDYWDYNTVKCAFSFLYHPRQYHLSFKGECQIWTCGDER